jgi:tetratricopeptide (TPR) repeat protein
MGKKKISRNLSRSESVNQRSSSPEDLLFLATRAHQNGNLSEALRSYRIYLKSRPDDAETWHTTGGILFQLGNVSGAIKALGKACKLASDNAVFISDLGGMYLSTEQFADAERALQSALALMPDSVGAHYNLSIALYRQNRISESVASLLRAVELQPNFSDAHYNLGIAFKLQGRIENAVNSFETAHRLQPENFRVQRDLADGYRDLGLTAQAIVHYEKYLGHSRDNDVVIEFSRTLQAHGSSERAENVLLDQIRRSPNDARLHLEVGLVQQIAGQLVRAESSLLRALELDPTCVPAILGLSRLRREENKNSPLLRKLNKTLSRVGQDTEESVALNFAIAKIYDDLAHYDDAFKHFKLANEIKCAHHAYSLELVQRRYSEMRDFFERPTIESLREFSSDSELPILVVGMPRSGTSLVEQIISSHPHAGGGGELQYFPSVIQQISQNLGAQDPYPGCLTKLDRPTADSVTSNYLNLLGRHCADGARVTDKLPGNFVNLGLFASLFPNGKIISCRREPVDMALSIYFQYFAEKHEYSWDLKRIAAHYAEYDRLMRYWQAVFPEMIFEIRYADVVRDIEDTAHKLMSFCGLDWDDRVLQFYETKRDVKTASNWQVRQPIYDRSLARWKNYEQHIAPLIEALRVHHN